MIFYVIGIIILSYLIAKTLTVKLENENTFLKNELVYIKSKHRKEIQEYKERVFMLNDAFDQFKKGNK